MKKLMYPKCPYCGRQVNPLLAFALKSEGEFRCTKCSGISNIELDSRIYKFAVSMVLCAAAVFITLELLVRQFSLPVLLIVIIPFLVFYCLSPLFIKLKRPTIKRRKMENRSPDSITGGITGNIYSNALQTAAGGAAVGVLNEEPTIQVGRVLPDADFSVASGAQLIPQEALPDLISERDSSQKILRQVEESVGLEAAPTFYSRPSHINVPGNSHTYRSPLKKKGGKNSER